MVLSEGWRRVHDKDRWREKALLRLTRTLAQHSADPSALPREARLDEARLRDVLQRQRVALLDRRAQLADEARTPIDQRPRIVVIHRQPWFRDKLHDAATNLGLYVVAGTDNGADGVGIAAAEQPAAVVLDEHVAMQTSTEVLRQLNLYCPHTRVLVHVESQSRLGTFLDAGADQVVVRTVPPADIAVALLTLVQSSDSIYPREPAR